MFIFIYLGILDDGLEVTLVMSVCNVFYCLITPARIPLKSHENSIRAAQIIEECQRLLMVYSHSFLCHYIYVGHIFRRMWVLASAPLLRIYFLFCSLYNLNLPDIIKMVSLRHITPSYS